MKFQPQKIMNDLIRASSSGAEHGYSIMKYLYLFLTLLLFLLPSAQSYAEESSLIFENGRLNGKIAIQTWYSKKFQRIVKQRKDYSCGAASIATILSEYYQRPTTEREVLSALPKGQEQASFADMEAILHQFGFRGVGLALSWEQLTYLKVPTIVYVKQRKTDHFTVVSGISKTHVKLSDPSLGNRILTRGQFKAIWQTRSDEKLVGKMLAILPLDEHDQSTDDSFFHIPAQLPDTKIFLDMEAERF